MPMADGWWSFRLRRCSEEDREVRSRSREPIFATELLSRTHHPTFSTHHRFHHQFHHGGTASPLSAACSAEDAVAPQNRRHADFSTGLSIHHPSENLRPDASIQRDPDEQCHLHAGPPRMPSTAEGSETAISSPEGPTRAEGGVPQGWHHGSQEAQLRRAKDCEGQIEQW
jgi:hypothetical protein